MYQLVKKVMIRHQASLSSALRAAFGGCALYTRLRAGVMREVGFAKQNSEGENVQVFCKFMHILERLLPLSLACASQLP